MINLPFPGRRQALLAVRENNHNVVVSLTNQPAWQKRKPFQGNGRDWYGNAMQATSLPSACSHVLDIWRFLWPRVLPQARGQPWLSDTWCHSSAWFVSQVWQCKICQMWMWSRQRITVISLNSTLHAFCREFYKDVTIGAFLWHIFINLGKSKSTLCLSVCQAINNATSIFNWPNDSSLKVYRDGWPSLKPTRRQFSCVEHW